MLTRVGGDDGFARRHGDRRGRGRAIHAREGFTLIQRNRVRKYQGPIVAEAIVLPVPHHVHAVAAVEEHLEIVDPLAPCGGESRHGRQGLSASRCEPIGSRHRNRTPDRLPLFGAAIIVGDRARELLIDLSRLTGLYGEAIADIELSLAILGEDRVGDLRSRKSRRCRNISSCRGSVLRGSPIAHR